MASNNCSALTTGVPDPSDFFLYGPGSYQIVRCDRDWAIHYSQRNQENQNILHGGSDAGGEVCVLYYKIGGKKINSFNSSCSLSLWRVVRGSKLMDLDLIHGLFIT